jgi:pimeloyl-ACP methyl ester carboxylesterase
MTSTITPARPASKTAATITVTSRDGTTIAVDRAGSGPPLVVVEGAFCTREHGSGKGLVPLLAERFTVYTYDRRGRGGSTDAAAAAQYSVEREIEDLAAVIEAAGGSAVVFGHSSGAALALEAASHGLPITKLALYEAPFVVDDSRPPVGQDYLARLKALVADGRRGAAVKLFMTEGVRVPAIFTAVLPLMRPVWSRLKAVAHTVTYDTAIVDPYLHGKPLPADRWSSVTAPVLVIEGGKSPAWIRNGMRALAAILPAATHQVIAGQTHMLKPKVTAPVLAGFLGE